VRPSAHNPTVVMSLRISFSDIFPRSSSDNMIESIGRTGRVGSVQPFLPQAFFAVALAVLTTSE